MLDRTKVLVVDDEKIVCESCRKALVQEGYEVSTATDPRHGLELAQKQDFGLVIVDLKMPGVSGLQVLSGIKETSPRTVAIIITAYPTAESAVESGRLGAVDYLLKPFTPDELCSKVREAIEFGETGMLESDQPISAEESASKEKGQSPPGQILVLGARKHAQAIQEIARSEQCSIEMAYDAEGVLERVRTGEVEVLIVGSELFGKEALDLIQAVREIQEDITIIVVSSDPSVDVAQRISEYGVLFHMVEPFGTEDIKAVIRGAANRVVFSGPLCSEARQSAGA